MNYCLSINEDFRLSSGKRRLRVSADSEACDKCYHRHMLISESSLTSEDKILSTTPKLGEKAISVPLLLLYLIQ